MSSFVIIVREETCCLSFSDGSPHAKEGHSQIKSLAKGGSHPWVKCGMEMVRDWEFAKGEDWQVKGIGWVDDTGVLQKEM